MFYSGADQKDNPLLQREWSNYNNKGSGATTTVDPPLKIHFRDG